MTTPDPTQALCFYCKVKIPHIEQQHGASIASELKALKETK